MDVKTKNPELNIISVTDKGLEREHNEDYHIFCPDLSKNKWLFFDKQQVKPEMGTLLVIADGMGGENAGEIASKLAIEGLRNFISTHFHPFQIQSEETIKNLLKNAILSGHSKIVSHQTIHPETEGMGTTIVIACIFINKVYVVWCGDSRCYCYNESTGLKKLSKDHSYVQQLVDEMKITEEQAFYHPDSNIITQNLGSKKHPPKPDFLSYPLNKNDRLLLCSDGLNSMLPDNKIREILQSNQNIEDCSKVLINEANNAGGHDNISIILCDVLDVETDGKSTEKKTEFESNRKRTIKLLVFSFSLLLIIFLLIYYFQPISSIFLTKQSENKISYDTLTTNEQKVHDSLEKKSKQKEDKETDSLSDSYKNLTIILLSLKSTLNDSKRIIKGENSKNFLSQIDLLLKLISSPDIKSIKTDSICKQLNKLVKLRQNLKVKSDSFNKDFKKIAEYQTKKYIAKSDSKSIVAESQSPQSKLTPNIPVKFKDKKIQKWGYIYDTLTYKIKPQYDDAREFKEGLAAVKLNNWGYININGDIIIQIKYEDARDFNEDLAAVQYDKNWGFINKKGEFVINPRYQAARDFHEGLAAVKISSKWGFVSTKGIMKVLVQFDSIIDDFSQGSAKVIKRSNMLLIDKDGKLIKPN